jgi:hypothetical protein
MPLKEQPFALVAPAPIVLSTGLANVLNKTVIAASALIVARASRTFSGTVPRIK